MRPITIKELEKLCKVHRLQGEGDKVIMISDDDEGNGYHYIWYTFCTVEEACAEDYIDEGIAKKEDTIINHCHLVVKELKVME